MVGSIHVALAILVMLLSAATTVAQSIVSIVPDSAKRSQPLVVTITGQNTHFQASSGTIVVQFKHDNYSMYMGGTIMSLTELRGVLTVPANAPLGYWNTIVNDYIDTIMTVPNSFVVYTDGTPALNTFAPSIGFQSDSLRITLTFANTNFSAGETPMISLTQGDSLLGAVNISVVNAISLAAYVKIPEWATGTWGVAVSGGGLPDMQRDSCLVVYQRNAHIVEIVPNTGYPGQMIPLTINFANTAFNVGGSYWVGINRLTESLSQSMTATMPTQLQKNLNIPLDAHYGAYSISVTDNIHPLMTLPNGFTIVPDPTPRLTTILPSSAKLGDTVSVTIAGPNNLFFASPHLVYLTEDVDTIAPLAVEILSFDSIRAVFAIPEDAAQGMWDFTIDSPLADPVVYANRFKVFGSAAIVSVDPVEAGIGDVVQVIISCQNVHFTVPGYYSPVVLTHGTDTLLVTAGPIDSLNLMAFLHVPSNASAGSWDITVPYDSSHSVSLPSGFRIYSECGDLNGSGQIDISDALRVINYIFAAGSQAVDRYQGDVNCSGTVEISDAVFMVAYIFASGPAPCEACK